MKIESQSIESSNQSNLARRTRSIRRIGIKSLCSPLTLVSIQSFPFRAFCIIVSASDPSARKKVCNYFHTLYPKMIDTSRILDATIGGDSVPIVLAMFVLLGIERLLYGYCYHFTDHFKRSVRRGSFGPKVQAEPLYWRAMMELGKWVKVFQFSVLAYDWAVRKNLSDDLTNPMEWTKERTAMFFVGLFLVLLGQFLNIAVFRALTPKGVYYGYEFGYPMERVTCFPYNTKFISDPQYWGVVICVWGAYIGLGSPILTVPILESFWYILSMQLFEHPRGKGAIERMQSFSGECNPQSPKDCLNEKEE